MPRRSSAIARSFRSVCRAACSKHSTKRPWPLTTNSCKMRSWPSSTNTPCVPITAPSHRPENACHTRPKTNAPSPTTSSALTKTHKPTSLAATSHDNASCVATTKKPSRSSKKHKKPSCSSSASSRHVPLKCPISGSSKPKSTSS